MPASITMLRLPHSISYSSVSLFFFVQTAFFLLESTVLCQKPNIINFSSPNLYPESLTWDPFSQQFLIGSLHNRTISSVSDAGVAKIFIFDPDLPENVSVLGLAVDNRYQRLLAVLHAIEPLPQFDALASYDLRSRRRLFLSELPTDPADKTRPIANDVAVDDKGNAFVTNAGNNYIWKVNEQGEASIFSRSPFFTADPVDRDTPDISSGLNGITYVSKGYFLVVQSSTGKLFKVDEVHGTAGHVSLNVDLHEAEDIVMRRDGVVSVVSKNEVWFLKGKSNWLEGVVFDKVALDVKRDSTSLVVGADNRVYVLYGHVKEGLKGEFGRDIFGIEEVRSKKESDDDNVWVFILIGLGVAYFLFWRFQMRQLVTKMDRKIH